MFKRIRDIPIMLAVAICCVCCCNSVAKATDGYGQAVQAQQGYVQEQRIIQYNYVQPQAVIVPLYQVERIQGDGYAQPQKVIQKQQKIVKQNEVVIVEDDYGYSNTQSQILKSQQRRIGRNAFILNRQRQQLRDNSNNSSRQVSRSFQRSRSR
jgi:hypothetical protein